MLEKTRACVKNCDVKTKWMNFLTKYDELRCWKNIMIFGIK